MWDATLRRDRRKALRELAAEAVLPLHRLKRFPCIE
jgi:hypothetical protein